MSGTIPIPSLPTASGTASTDLFLVTQVSGAVTPQLNMPRPLMAQGILADIASGAAGSVVLPSPVVSGVLLLPFATGMTASATGQAAATPIVAMRSYFSTVAVSGSAILPTGHVGGTFFIGNRGANPLFQFPNVGAQIETQGTNTAVEIAAGGNASFDCVSSGQWQISG